MYSQPQHTNSLAEIHRLEDADREYFNQHLDREFRLRRAHPVEYYGTPAKTEIIYKIMHRDDVARYEDHDFFKAPINFDPALTDKQIRDFLAEIRKHSR